MRNILFIMFTIASFTNLVAQPAAGEAIELLENETGFGIRAKALGNAYTAVADDYSAIYWNPAGLAQIKKWEVSGDINYFKYQNTTCYFGTETSDSRNFTRLQSIGLVYPFPVARGNFVLALGYQRIKNLDSFLDFNGLILVEDDLAFSHINPPPDTLFQAETISTDGSLSQWSFGAAIDLSPIFSAGLTVSIYGGGSAYSSDFGQEYLYFYEYDSIEFNYFNFQQKIKNDFSGVEFKLGGLFHITRFLRLGATITFPMKLNINESFTEEECLGLDTLNRGIYDMSPPIYYGANDYEYSIKVPFKFSAGVSYQIPILLISAAIDYRDWSQLRYDAPDNLSGSIYDILFDENKNFSKDYRAVVSYSVGGELNLFNSRLSLRGGFRYLPSPLKDVGSKYDKQFYSAGLGVKVDRTTTVEMSFVQGNWKSTSYDVYTWDVDEKIKTTDITIGVRLNF